ncbi:transcription termination factor Rho [Anaplasmataceae bacterium AB001_6]|nr:transcription termination factor Rho [Anaplasmataceae bacterium AB001_6]
MSSLLGDKTHAVVGSDIDDAVIDKSSAALLVDKVEKPSGAIIKSRRRSNNKNHDNNGEAQDAKTEESETEKNVEIIDVSFLRKYSIGKLLEVAKTENLDDISGLTKSELISALVKKIFERGGASVISSGVVEVLGDGFAFIRTIEANLVASPDDVYISPGQVRRFSLRTGDNVVGEIRVPKKDERYFALTKIISINGESVFTKSKFVNFDSLTPVFPNEKLKLECESSGLSNKENISARIIDIMAPLGKGQRALIVAPPKTGKTMLLKTIAHSIAQNHSDTHLMVLLIDERPEEVTDMQRFVKGDVISSTFDEPAHRHVQLAELVIARARRMVERGRDVVILLDSITRLARAYNAVVPSSGKVLTGGVDSNALQRPKRCFGAARNIEQGGSLTIVATALVETGSRMDDVIFEEFKGTGNCEIILDRKLSDKRIFPAIDITRSGTRNEEKLIDSEILSKVWILRRVLNNMGVSDSMSFLREKIEITKNNNSFFEAMKNFSSN